MSETQSIFTGAQAQLLRKQRGWDHDTAARKAYVSTGRLREFEAGKYHFTDWTLERLHRALVEGK